MQYRPAFDATQPVISFILQTIIVLGLLCLPVAMAALPALLTFNPILIALAVAAAAVSSIGLALFAGRPLGRLLSYPATVVLVTPVWLLDRTLEGLWNMVPNMHAHSPSEASAVTQPTETDRATPPSTPAVVSPSSRIEVKKIRPGTETEFVDALVNEIRSGSKDGQRVAYISTVSDSFRHRMGDEPNLQALIKAVTAKLSTLGFGVSVRRIESLPITDDHNLGFLVKKDRKNITLSYYSLEKKNEFSPAYLNGIHGREAEAEAEAEAQVNTVYVSNTMH